MYSNIAPDLAGIHEDVYDQKIHAYRICNSIEKRVDNQMLYGIIFQADWTLPLHQPQISREG